MECDDCNFLREKASKYQKHGHTFTCSKKGKTITIKSNEGHRKNDGHEKGPELRNIPLCRFNIPKFPMDKTILILGISKDLDETIISKRTKDLSKIKKYLIRQTFTEENLELSENWRKLKKIKFLDLLFQVGMFDDEKPLSEFDQTEVDNAMDRKVL